MKKLVCLVLAAALLLTFTACGSRQVDWGSLVDALLVPPEQTAVEEVVEAAEEEAVDEEWIEEETEEAVEEAVEEVVEEPVEETEEAAEEVAAPGGQAEAVVPEEEPEEEAVPEEEAAEEDPAPVETPKPAEKSEEDPPTWKPRAESPTVGIWSAVQSSDLTNNYFICMFSNGSAIRYSSKRMDVGRWTVSGTVCTAVFDENYAHNGTVWRETEEPEVLTINIWTTLLNVGAASAGSDFGKQGAYYPNGNSATYGTCYGMIDLYDMMGGDSSELYAGLAALMNS